LQARFPRTLVNLKSAIGDLRHVRVFDNGNLRRPYRLVTVIENGRLVELHKPTPMWLRPLLPIP
jgi:hypothetical protein